MIVLIILLALMIPAEASAKDNYIVQNTEYSLISDVPSQLFEDPPVEIEVNEVNLCQSEQIVGYKTITKKIKVKVRKKQYLGKFYITHYCPCVHCCGVGGGKVTASGTRPKAGRTVGVNRRLIKFGTKLKVGNRWTYVAEDTGGGIGWKYLDVFCNSHREALNAGVGYRKVWAYKTYKKKVKVGKGKWYKA